MKKPELLSPAGSLETALAAFDGGADAVYCGLAKFNARERAVNFSFPEMRTLLEKAHDAGKKVYITFNTLLRDDEFDEAAAFLSELAKSPPDALIVQDPGVINLVNKYFPFFTVHSSTQMGIHNSCGVEMMKQLNVKRVILERQITLDELKKIRKRTDLELEVFINGSLCCSLSGRCLLSSYLNGTSGNRGRCKQPCRRCYAAVDNSKQDYFLSPYDLDGSSLVAELSSIGIDSFKIEGRLRGSDYIFKTARAYRTLIDHNDDPAAVEEALKLLNSASMRDSSTGFYFLDGKKSIINSKKSGIFGVEAGNVASSRNGTISLKTQIRLHLGDRLRVVNVQKREDSSFSLTRLFENGKSVIKCRAGSNVVIGTAPDFPVGSKVYKIGENGFDYRSAVENLRPGRYPGKLKIFASPTEWKVVFSHFPELVWSKQTDFAPALKRPLAADDIRDVFLSAPAEPWRIEEAEVVCEGSFFVPGSQLKDMRRVFWNYIKNNIPPFENWFSKEKNALENYLNRAAASVCPAEIAAPQNAFVIPAFVAENDIAKVKKELDGYLKSGKRQVIVEAFHGFEMLKNAPADTEIYVRFPLPVTNSFAADLMKELGAAAFAPEVELDKETRQKLYGLTELPHFCDDTPTPLLVTRTALDRTKRTDGSGHVFKVQKSASEGTFQLYIENAEYPLKFKDF